MPSYTLCQQSGFRYQGERSFAQMNNQYLSILTVYEVPAERNSGPGFHPASIQVHGKFQSSLSWAQRQCPPLLEHLPDNISTTPKILLLGARCPPRLPGDPDRSQFPSLEEEGYGWDAIPSLATARPYSDF